MAFEDALQDTVSIFTVAIGFKTGDSVGQEVKTPSALYSNVKGRLNSFSNAALSLSLSSQGKQESMKSAWVLEVAPRYNGASRGDKVTVNGEAFIITKKHEIRGRSSAIHHVVYYLEEAK